MAELPQVVETYNKYHDRGLEIIGVSNDMEISELLAFLKQHPEVKWPQLFAPSSSASHWNTLTERFGVDSIPRVYLIDRSGVLRSVTARGRLEQLIPQLLDEQPDASIAAGEDSTAGATSESKSPSSDTPAAAADQAARSAPAADETAEKAAHALSMAKNYIAAQRYDLARARLQKVIEAYPGTRAADESKALLKEIAGK